MACVLNNVLKFSERTKLVVSQVRYYPRWNHRRPLKVYTSEEYDEIERKLKKKPQSVSPVEAVFDKEKGFRPKWERIRSENVPVKFNLKPKKLDKPLVATNQKSKVKTATDMFETVIDNEGNFIYTKMDNNDQRVGLILTEVKSKKEKNKKDLVLLEGKRLIKDALLSGCHLKYILFSRKAEVEYLKPFLPKLGAQLYKMPYREMQMWSDLTTSPGIMGVFQTPDVENFSPKGSIPVSVVCDNIREPGNLGTILRICAAVGCQRVVLTKGCVNLWDSKVLRSSVGAHFKLQIHKNLEWDKIEDLVGPNSNFFIADNKIVNDCDENSDLVTVLEKIPLLPYYGVDFAGYKDLVLIVGGETLGVSKESYELALKTKGARLNIPLSNEIDSLNVGSALGVIAFEIKKQLTVCK